MTCKDSRGWFLPAHRSGPQSKSRKVLFHRVPWLSYRSLFVLWMLLSMRAADSPRKVAALWNSSADIAPSFTAPPLVEPVNFVICAFSGMQSPCPKCALNSSTHWGSQSHSRGRLPLWRVLSQHWWPSWIWGSSCLSVLTRRGRWTAVALHPPNPSLHSYWGGAYLSCCLESNLIASASSKFAIWRLDLQSWASTLMKFSPSRVNTAIRHQSLQVGSESAVCSDSRLVEHI